MKVYENDDRIIIDLTRDEASALRAFMFRDGKNPRTTIYALRSLLWEIEEPRIKDGESAPR